MFDGSTAGTPKQDAPIPEVGDHVEFYAGGKIYLVIGVDLETRALRLTEVIGPPPSPPKLISINGVQRPLDQPGR